jgi:hypothetical protein
MLRKLESRHWIEVGCGFSSAVALDTSERFLDGRTKFTFIDPYPETLRAVARPADLSRHQLVPKIVQDVPLDVYDQLESNDVLFIDSSHVSKVGSDVNHLVFQVLPRLRAGVVVHSHDVCFPFEYPEIWLEEGRAWNEVYLVRAFLQHNSVYRVLLFSSFVARRFHSFLEKKMPLCLRNPGGSLWLQKMR